MTTNWKTTFSPARLAEKLPDGRVRCHLSPRNCTMREGQDGFCKVRGVRNGELVTMNYGKSVHPTQETIETEAVNHFLPGAKILSFGNIGCMMSCSYCHNWRTSQAKYVQDGDIYAVTPEEAVALAKRRGLGVISYTYNDPVVWHEWVLETAQRAREAGIINLYKSAFYISEEAIDELLPHIDIFSISLKSMDPHYYKKITAARLEPVLDGIRQVYRSGRHLELSNLMITDLSDDEASARKLADFILRELDDKVPMHYVRFHPDYRMRNTTRTPIPRLEKALQVARSMGIQHVYLGNVYDTPHSNTYCNSCSAQLVTRYGLNASTAGLSETGHCKRCGTDAHIKRPALDLSPIPLASDDEVVGTRRTFDWHGDVRSLHVHMHTNQTDKILTAWHRRRLGDGTHTGWEPVTLQPGESWRFIIAKSSTDDLGPEIVVPEEMNTNLHEVFDRAHFPTISVEEAPATGDVTPFPLYEGHATRTAR